MSMLNEAGAVNAQRDAHMAGGSVLERRMRSLEEMRREGEMATQMDNILDTSMRLGGVPTQGRLWPRQGPEGVTA